MLQRTQEALLRSGHGCSEIAGDSMLDHSCFDSGKRTIVCFHHIVTGAAMDMNVDETGRENQVRIINVAGANGDFRFNT
jgi:hypothetical protein